VTTSIETSTESFSSTSVDATCLRSPRQTDPRGLPQPAKPRCGGAWSSSGNGWHGHSLPPTPDGHAIRDISMKRLLLSFAVLCSLSIDDSIGACACACSNGENLSYCSDPSETPVDCAPAVCRIQTGSGVVVRPQDIPALLPASALPAPAPLAVPPNKALSPDETLWEPVLSPDAVRPDPALPRS